jgi:hypothetical protein
MQKTKFKVDILKSGTYNSPILKMIASHNEGRVLLSIPDFISYNILEKAQFPASANLFEIERDVFDEQTKFNVSEDGGKTFTLTIEEIEIHELADDLKDINVFTNSVHNS